MGWGAAFLDADLDGRLDLFLANGHIFPNVDEYPDLKESFRQRNQLLLNEGGTFRDVSDAAGGGLQVRKSSRGLAVGDLDNDGRLDVVINNLDGAPQVLRNELAGTGKWLLLKLQGKGKNTNAIGAVVTAKAGKRSLMRLFQSWTSCLSQDDMRQHLGLGQEKQGD